MISFGRHDSMRTCVHVARVVTIGREHSFA